MLSGLDLVRKGKSCKPLPESKHIPISGKDHDADLLLAEAVLELEVEVDELGRVCCLLLNFRKRLKLARAEVRAEAYAATTPTRCPTSLTLAEKSIFGGPKAPRGAPQEGTKGSSKLGLWIAIITSRWAHYSFLSSRLTMFMIQKCVYGTPARLDYCKKEGGI